MFRLIFFEIEERTSFNHNILMRIQSVEVEDFKRFKHLKISDIPESARLVVLVGPNGSGKTSLFEAFNYIYSDLRRAHHFDTHYHSRGQRPQADSWSTVRQRIKVEAYGVNFNNEVGTDIEKKRFYFRTAYRHEPEFSVSNISKLSRVLDDNKQPNYLFQTETRVSDNYHRIVADTVAEIYKPGGNDQSKRMIRDRIIGKVRDAVANVFGDILLSGPGDPMNDGTFLFSKGNVSDFRYKNLSGGEKAAFDLLLDFVVKTETFDDTVFCIDEPELHMHSKLQGILLKEMFDRVPDKSQLWISTHSIGMLHQAKKLFDLDNECVAFVDFHDRDFEKSVVMKPSTPTREFWRKIFGVAIDELSDLMAPQTLIFCEGKMGSNGGRGLKPFGFDPRAYRQIFGSTYSDVEFSSLGGDKDVSTLASLISSSLMHVLPGVKFGTLLDRDDRTDDQVETARRTSNRVLRVRDLENYLWADEILAKLCTLKGYEGKIEQVLTKKAELVSLLPTRKLPPDDIKSIAGELFNYLKIELVLSGCGNNQTDFAIATLAPLVTPETETYKQLEQDVLVGFPR